LGIITFVLAESAVSSLKVIGNMLVYAPGVTMTQETYRLAYEEASTELKEILGQFEVLRIRREKIQQVAEALKPLLADGPLPEPAANPAAEPFLVQQASNVAVEPAPVAAPEVFPEPAVEPEPAFASESSDPFQRRIDNALRHGLGARESRILPRALNGLLSRA
jgi:hypothetical protein